MKQQTEWIHCPMCGNKTRVRIREDTVLYKRQKLTGGVFDNFCLLSFIKLFLTEWIKFDFYLPIRTYHLKSESGICSSLLNDIPLLAESAGIPPGV